VLSMKRFSMSVVLWLLYVALSVHVARAQTPQRAGTSGAGAAKSSTAIANKAPAKAAPAAKIKFRPFEVVDQQQGGMVVSRFAVPQDWKATSRTVWNYNDYFIPVRTHARAEAPDGSSWIEFYPAEFFEWLYPPPRIRSQWVGGIQHPNITLPLAMVRYVIAPNRGRAKSLRLVGYRAVNDMPKQFPRLLQGPGEGICMRVQYELDGSLVDEEFYGFMPPVDRIPAGNGAEYHRGLYMVHSMGAKSGKLESVRPVLGFIGTSIEPNPAWQARLGEIKKKQMEYFNQSLANTYAGIRAAGEMSRATSRQNDQFIQRMDANRAAQNRAQSASSWSSTSNEDFYKHADGFDQYVRGTEHMQDQNGAVTDQYTDYNYHWTDANGTFVHTNDPNLDPNRYLNGNYQQMTPQR